MILRPNPVGIAPSFPSKIPTSSPSTRSDTDSKVGDDMVITKEQIDTWTLPCERVLLALNPWLVMHSLGEWPEARSPLPPGPPTRLELEGVDETDTHSKARRDPG